MIVAATPPPSVVASAPIPSRNVMVWGEVAAREALRKAFEAKGWRWATMILGEKTEALLLIPPETVSDEDITQIVSDLNAGKYGKLSGGYAQVGAPDSQNGSIAS